MGGEEMDRLHAYWRMEYMEAPKESEEHKRSLFEHILEHGDDEEVYILHRDKHSYIMLNKYPYNAGHLMVVPYRGVANLADLTEEERSNLMMMVVKAQEVLEKGLKAEGFNIGFNIGKAAGAGIPKHLHCHVVPRWLGDTNFMPVLGETKVLPESLASMYKRLKKFV